MKSRLFDEFTSNNLAVMWYSSERVVVIEGYMPDEISPIISSLKYMSTRQQNRGTLLSYEPSRIKNDIEY